VPTTPTGRFPAPRGTEARFQRQAVYGILLILAIGAIGFAEAVLMPVTAAVLTGLLFGPVQARMERWGVASFLAAALILLGLLATVLAALRLMLLPFETWVDRLPEMWAALRLQLYSLRGLVLAVQDATEAVQETAGLEESGESVVLTGPELLGSIAASVPALGAQAVLFIGVLFFYLATRRRLRAKLLSLCLDRRARLRTARIIQDCEHVVSRYVGTIALINIGLAVTTGLALTLVGTPNAWFWGALAGLLNFVPYIGPAILTVLLLGVGLLQEGQWFQMVLPALTFFVINFIEANFVTPTILGRIMTIEPILVVISLAVWLWLWGPIGAFLAVPLLLVIQVTAQRLLQ
jgi:predicted PurR-regulated permease PerM